MRSIPSHLIMSHDDLLCDPAEILGQLLLTYDLCAFLLYTSLLVYTSGRQVVACRPNPTLLQKYLVSQQKFEVSACNSLHQNSSHESTVGIYKAYVNPNNDDLLT